MKVDKVIFLDFDGPMIPMRSWVLENITDTLKWQIFDPVATKTIRLACDLSGAKIVISSSWRCGGKDICFTCLTKNNLDPDKYIHKDWRTKNLADGLMDGRPKEIKEWLSRHQEVTTFVVIDDADLNMESVDLNTENFVHVTFYDGIMLEDQGKIFKLLDIPMYIYKEDYESYLKAVGKSKK